MIELGEAMRPKHHLWLHLIQRAGYLGNPRMYWTFADEGANRELARIAGASHAMTWTRRILTKWAWVCQQGLGKKRKHA